MKHDAAFLAAESSSRAAVFQNQLDGCAHALAALFQSVPLSVGASNLKRPADKPFAVALDDPSEFIPHWESIARSLVDSQVRKFGLAAPVLVVEFAYPELGHPPASYINRSCDKPRLLNMTGREGIRSVHRSCLQSSRWRSEHLHFHECCQRLRRRWAYLFHIAGRYRIADCKSLDLLPPDAGENRVREVIHLPPLQNAPAISAVHLRTEAPSRNSSK